MQPLPRQQVPQLLSRRLATGHVPQKAAQGTDPTPERYVFKLLRECGIEFKSVHVSAWEAGPTAFRDVFAIFFDGFDTPHCRGGRGRVGIVPGSRRLDGRG